MFFTLIFQIKLQWMHFLTQKLDCAFWMSAPWLTYLLSIYFGIHANQFGKYHQSMWRAFNFDNILLQCASMIEKLPNSVIHPGKTVNITPALTLSLGADESWEKPGVLTAAIVTVCTLIFSSFLFFTCLHLLHLLHINKSSCLFI